MTPIPFLIAAAILAIIGAIIVAWARRAEDKERRKLQNYARARLIGIKRAIPNGEDLPGWVEVRDEPYIELRLKEGHK